MRESRVGESEIRLIKKDRKGNGIGEGESEVQ